MPPSTYLYSRRTRSSILAKLGFQMENSKAIVRLAVVLVFFAWVAAGQTTQGLIAGRLVNSQTGAPIAGAQVSYSNGATGSSGAATSDSSGAFFLPMLSQDFTASELPPPATNHAKPRNWS